ncbi:two-component response regulator ORR41-like isoform X2 [Carica papaya]|nr:two-component response regulator ORR41-like isoform X2 [Carica papaya]
MASESAPVTSAAAPSRRRPSVELPEFKLKNKQLNAFVVDEHEFSCKIEKAFLGYFGVRAETMGSAAKAMELIRGGQSVDLILIEKFLEDMDGIEATKQLRAMGVTCKIMAVCCYPFEEVGEQFLAAGADIYNEKPLDFEKLVEVLKELDGQ